jgi:hypothetical protein
MALSANLKKLIEANAPLWAGEAEIIRTYCTSAARSGREMPWPMR